MADKSKIAWTNATWNPVTGCTKISEGCANCYAERMAHRLQAMGQVHYKDGFAVRMHPDTLDIPYDWKKPRRVFVCSMSDIFHEDVHPGFVFDVWHTMVVCHRHTYQVLTKRPERTQMLGDLRWWPQNIWMGVTVENGRNAPRIAILRKIPATVRWLSLEPLLSRIPPHALEGMDWVVVGGESGPGARECKPEWVREIRDACVKRHIPFFFKQWGPHGAGRLLDGQEWSEFPGDRAISKLQRSR